MGHALSEFTDRANCGGIAKVITLTPGQIVELKIGANALTDREYVEFEALDTGVKWGFGNGAGERPFDAFKSQHFTRPYGENVTVFFENTKGTNVSIAIGEVG